MIIEEEIKSETRKEMYNLTKALELTQLILIEDINTLYDPNLLIQIIKLRQNLLIELNKHHGIFPAE